MPAHIAVVLSIALLSVHSRASDEAGEPAWDEGARAELDEVEDRGALEADLAPDVLLLGDERAMPVDERSALE